MRVQGATHIDTHRTNTPTEAVWLRRQLAASGLLHMPTSPILVRLASEHTSQLLLQLGVVANGVATEGCLGSIQKLPFTEAGPCLLPLPPLG